MKEIAVGVAVLFFIQLVRPRPIKIEGFGAILFMILLSYGIGTIGLKLLGMND